MKNRRFLVWIIISFSVLIIALTAGYIWINNMPVITQSGDSEQTRNQEEKEPESNSDTEVKATETTSNQSSGEGESDVYISINEVISDFHAYYNSTLGYGRIDHVSWGDQRNKAQEFIAAVTKLEGTFDGTIKTDVGQAMQFASKIADGSDSTTNLTSIHRILHDLDIAVNGFSNYDKIWGVTETKVK